MLRNSKSPIYEHGQNWVHFNNPFAPTPAFRVIASFRKGLSKQNGHHFGGRFVCFSVCLDSTILQKMILWIIFRRERVGIHDDPEHHCLSPQAILGASPARERSERLQPRHIATCAQAAASCFVITWDVSSRNHTEGRCEFYC